MNPSQHRPLPVQGVDTHAHVFTPDLPLAQGRRYAPEYTASVEEYLAQLDCHGLSHGVLVQPSFLGTDNRFLIEAIQTAPERLRGVAVVEPTTSLDELARYHDEGIRGIRLNLVGVTEVEVDTPAYRQLFARVAMLGWSIQIQRSLNDVMHFLPVIMDAGAPVVIDHFGLPGQGVLERHEPTHRSFLEALSGGQLWVKLSADYRCHMSLEQARDSVALMREVAGIDRFLWGSDWPHTRFEQKTTFDRQWTRFSDVLTDTAERHQVLVDNPTRLFGLDADPSTSEVVSC